MMNDMALYKVLIVEDEFPAREILKTFLNNHPDFQLVGECSNGFDGAMAIKNLEPDVLFLDIQMPKLTGFEMLELIDNPPLIVFTTAFDEFAIKAFEVNAVDYLLKPFSEKRFAQAISKIKEALGSPRPDSSKLKTVLEYVRNNDEIINRLVVKLQNRIQIILVSDIERIEAQDDYVFIHTMDGERYIKEITMKYLENHLNSADFVRVHRSHIIRVDRISRIEPEGSDSYSIMLKSTISVPLSKTGYKKLRQIIGV